jgi:drug/metabolite transporter (DMT)-like permease
MNRNLGSSYPGEWLGVSGLVSAASLAAYYAFLSALPACGPPGDTFLGQIYFIVPIAIVFAAALILVGIGRLRTWRTSQIIGGVVMVIAITLIGGFIVWIHFFAIGDCGD